MYSNLGLSKITHPSIQRKERANKVGARFTRLDVFVDHVNSEWGEIHPVPRKIMAYKNEMYPELLLLTDIQVKYKTMLRPLAASAALAIRHGSDGLVITGDAMGVETPMEKIKTVREKFPHFPIFVGAGIHGNNIREQLAFANGAIVGPSIKSGANIDVVKATRLRQKI